MKLLKSLAPIAILAALLLLFILPTGSHSQSLNGGNQVVQSFPEMTGTNVPPNLPALAQGWFYLSQPEGSSTYPVYSGTAIVATGTTYTTGTTPAYLYYKLLGTSATNGFVNLSSSNPATVVQ